MLQGEPLYLAGYGSNSGRPHGDFIMTVQLLPARWKWKAILAGCGLLLVLVQSAARAQTPSGAVSFGTWRESFSRQLDQEIAELTSSGHPHKIASTGAEDSRNDDTSAVDSFPGPTQREVARLPRAVPAILRAQGLPASLIDIPAVESGFNPLAMSPKGAAGLWQLMPATARRFGLVISPERDDRFDPSKSTVAAASYLRSLYNEFHNWPLVLAAYNAGENRVKRATARADQDDFWLPEVQSGLPGETRRYVRAVLALVSENGGGAPDDVSNPLSPRKTQREEISMAGIVNSGNVIFASTSPVAPSVP